MPRGEKKATAHDARRVWTASDRIGKGPRPKVRELGPEGKKWCREEERASRERSSMKRCLGSVVSGQIT